MIAFIVEWLLLILAVGFVIPAFVFNEHRNYTSSTVFLIISSALASWFFWGDIQTTLQTHGLVKSSVIFLFTYCGMGLFTAFLFWISYNIRAKEKYQELFDRIYSKYDKLPEPLRSVCVKKEIISNHDDLRNIFDDKSNELIFPTTFQSMYNHQAFVLDHTEDGQAKLLEQYAKEVDKVLPPRFKTCKPFILGSAICWPITIIWLIFSRVVKQIINVLINMFGGMFNRIAKLSFGSF